MYGHSHPAIKEAIERVLQLGHSLGGVNPQEAGLAEKLVSRFPSIDKICFCNSGNEENLFAIATALSFNRRRKLMVFGSGYHGITAVSQSRLGVLVLVCSRERHSINQASLESSSEMA